MRVKGAAAVAHAPPIADNRPPDVPSPDAETIPRAKPAAAAPRTGVAAPVLWLALTAALFAGWQYRDEGHLTAESGLGYALGIIGGLMMLLLLLYPVRKKARFMRRWGPIKYWFRLHMLFGAIGPTLVLYHASFKIGSINGTMALGSMALVALSGLVGRYIYTRIHYGLYGSRATLEGLHRDTEANRSRLGLLLANHPAIQERLKAHEDAVLEPSPNLRRSARRLIVIGVRTRATRRAIAHHLRRAMSAQARQAGWTARQRRHHWRSALGAVTHHLAVIRKVVEFSFFERLFAAWHVLHLPLFFMMLIAGTVHVVAVHMY